MDTQGSKGILLGQPTSTTTAVWNREKDRIDRVTGARVDEGGISLKQPDLLATVNGKSSMDTETDSSNPQDDEILLQSTKGFAAYTPGIASRDKSNTMHMAMKRPDSNKWRQAMAQEYEKLQLKDIYDLIWIEEMPKGVRVYPGKWVYDTKEDFEPTDDRAYKASWVIFGNMISKHDLQ